MNSLRLRQCLTEALGAFLLASSVGLSLMHPGVVPTPVVAGLTLGVLVYAIGALSGCQINPAVTVGLWSIGKLKSQQALQYVVAQLIGGGIASLVLGWVHGDMFAVAATNTLPVMIAEACGAAVLTFGVSSVVYEKTPGGAAGLVIGGSLLLGVLAASVASNGVLNPAVAIGIGSVSLAYLLAPLAGGIVGAWGYRLVAAGR